MEKKEKNKGITLVALVITIIILLMLAGVSITALTKSDLLKNAKTSKNATENAQNTENIALAEYQDKIDQYIESGRDVALSDEVKSYIDNKISEVEKVEITKLASDWILTYNNSVKKGDMVYLEFALSKQTSWSYGWNNNIAKIPVLSNENTHKLTLNTWEGKGTGEILLNNGDISVFEVGTYGNAGNMIVVNATFYIGEK
jgi:type II secretory pathway pseudopilin PulG